MDGTRLLAPSDRLWIGKTDEEAVAELYARHAERVRRYLTGALGDRGEAEDVTQQVFLNVALALPRFEQRGVPVEAWLFRIVKNCVIDHSRRRRQDALEDPFTLARRRERLEAGAPPALAGLLASAAFEELVSTLPPLQRQVLALRYQLDFANARIAVLLRRSELSIRQAHHQALRTLQARAAAVPEPPSRRRLPLAMRRACSGGRDGRFARLRPLPAIGLR